MYKSFGTPISISELLAVPCTTVSLNTVKLYSFSVVLFLQKIEEAAEKGELNELVLMVIWNRLDLARRDVCAILVLLY